MSGRRPALDPRELLASDAPAVELGGQSGSLPVKDQIALREEKVRRVVSYWIVGLFGGLNIATICVIIWLGRVDQRDVIHKLMPASGRVIDTGVIMSLLGATTVQLGTIAVIMARFVFREPD